MLNSILTIGLIACGALLYQNFSGRPHLITYTNGPAQETIVLPSIQNGQRSLASVDNDCVKKAGAWLARINLPNLNGSTRVRGFFTSDQNQMTTFDYSTAPVTTGSCPVPNTELGSILICIQNDSSRYIRYSIESETGTKWQGQILRNLEQCENEVQGATAQLISSSQ